MPHDKRKAGEFLARDAEEVVMHLHEAKSIAEERHLKQCTKPERNIVETRAYWNPLVHRGDLLFWNETVVRLVECADNLLGRTPWLAALSYSLSLKYKDMQSLSRQYFFRTIEGPCDPGNAVYSYMLLVCICRSGAYGNDVGTLFDQSCTNCDRMPGAMPELINILCTYSNTSKIQQAQLLLICMQKRFSNLRFVAGCNVEKAGDVIESTGCILSPWRASAKSVLYKLTQSFNLREDDVKETVEAMGAFVRHCINFYTQSLQLNMDKTEVYNTIRKWVKPKISPCSGTCCPVCESLAALSRTQSIGSASSVMDPAAQHLR